MMGKDIISGASSLPIRELIALKDRGYIKEGCKADLVLFKPEELEEDGNDNKGFEAIMIAGKPSLMNGKWFYPRAGEVL